MTSSTPTASLMPNGRTQFLDGNGKPLAGGNVYYYVPDTTTFKTTWQDPYQTTANTNPVGLDSNGEALIYGNGMYSQVVYDQNNVQIWNAYTAASINTISGTVVSFANIAALRANNTAPGETTVWVDGYYSGNDGGEGMFWWASADTASADNNGTIIVDANGNRWYRQTAKAQPWSILWFGLTTGSGDNTALMNGMISTLASAGGGVIYVPEGTFTFTGTISIQANNIRISGANRGASIFNFNNGASNCIVVGTSYATVIYNTIIEGLTLQGTSKTGGVGISILSSAESIYRDLILNNMANGVYVQFINNVLIQDAIILLQNSSGYSYAVHWYCVAAAAQVGNVLALTNVTINCNGNGAQGIWLDGACDTLRLQAVGVLHSVNGLLVQNTQLSNQYFPQFVFANDLEIDGVTQSCINIQAGRVFHFTNCDFFNNFSGESSDTDVVQIAADGAYSITSNIYFNNCRIAGAQQNGIYCTGKNLYMSNCYVGDNSVAGSGAYNGISLGNAGGSNGAAGHVIISNCQIGASFGDLGYQNYGIVAAAGVTEVSISNCDFTYCVAGGIQDNTGAVGNVMWHGCIDINGQQIPDRLPAQSSAAATTYNGIIYYNASAYSIQAVVNGTLETLGSGGGSYLPLSGGNVTGGSNFEAGLGISATPSANPIGSATSGWYIGTGGAAAGYSAGSTPLNLGIGTNGGLINFYYGGASAVGSIGTNGSSVSYNTTSDYRLKVTFGLVMGMDQVDDVPIHLGRFKSEPEAQPRPMMLAHELTEAGFGYAVSGEKNAVDAEGGIVPQQVDYLALIPVLWAEIKSLRRRMRELETGQ